MSPTEALAAPCVLGIVFGHRLHDRVRNQPGGRVAHAEHGSQTSLDSPRLGQTDLIHVLKPERQSSTETRFSSHRDPRDVCPRPARIARSNARHRVQRRTEPARLLCWGRAGGVWEHSEPCPRPAARFRPPTPLCVAVTERRLQRVLRDLPG
jgi:hypothetical protein